MTRSYAARSSGSTSSRSGGGGAWWASGIKSPPSGRSDLRIVLSVCSDDVGALSSIALASLRTRGGRLSTPVDDDSLPCHELGVRGGQKTHDGAHVFWTAHPSERLACIQRRHRIRPVDGSN